jgi:hypothetical protein
VKIAVSLNNNFYIYIRGYKPGRHKEHFLLVKSQSNVKISSKNTFYWLKVRIMSKSLKKRHTGRKTSHVLGPGCGPYILHGKCLEAIAPFCLHIPASSKELEYTNSWPLYSDDAHKSCKKGRLDVSDRLTN